MKKIRTVDMTGVKCPLCGAEMAGKTNSQSFAWVCKECPGVLFEFYNEKDIGFLKETL
jgi:endogenous inhibitor of DNA gyrase (YacG/DUF329 family)